MDPQGKNAVVSSIQNEELETQYGLERLSRIVKVNDRWVEHKKHQDIIDYILDRKCPIKFSFRKRVHKRRGSLFKKVSRPNRSQKAQRSRSSFDGKAGLPAKLNKSRGSNVNVLAMSKSRGSGMNVLAGEKPSSKKPKTKPNNFHAQTINQWSDDDISKEQREMMQQIALLSAGNKNLTRGNMEKDPNLKNLSPQLKTVLDMKSTGNFDGLTDAEKQDLGEFGKEMFDLWTSMDDADVGGGTVDEQDEAAAYVIQEANKLRQQAQESSANLLSDDDVASPRGLAVPVAGRMRASSSPVYSTDALVELHKGCALMKYGRRGSPKFRIFQLSKDNKFVMWFSDKKDPEQTRIPLEEMIRIEKNLLHDSRSDDELRQTSFAIVYNEENEQKLRLTAKNATEAYLWTEGLKKLIERKDNNEPLGAIKHLILDKQPGLDLHRRQSLANLMEKRTGAAGANMRDKSVKKIRRELKAIRKNYEKCDASTGSKKFDQVFESPEILGVDGGVIKTLDQHNKELEKKNILDVLENIRGRLDSLDQQVVQLDGMHEDMFDGSLQQIKADAWNCSVDLVALQSKIKVLISSANPVIL